METVNAFLKRKNIVFSARRYGVDALGAMAQGLFCSLLIGTIVKTLGEQAGIAFLVDVGNFAAAMSGAAMAVAIGYALQAPPLVLFSLATVGYAANALGSTSLIPDQAGAGGPLAVLFIAIIAAEFGKAVSKETKIDILVTPLVTILVGVALSAWWAPAIGTAATAVGNIIMWATDLQPFLMGVIVSVVIGVALTLPISSAAICAAFGLTGLAGGAAVAGCCANMVGFAVLSFRENGWGGLVSQGLGTSMLQMGNILKNPRVWLPAILTSAVTGPLATCVFRLEMNGPPVSSGMGTCGLVGQIGVWTGWLSPSERALANGAAAVAPGAMDWLGLILISFVLPAVLCWAFGLLFRRIGWIKPGDLTLQ
ncbi:MAG: PTS sugar transporter subunit IIC [Oscillospiraceae bacterium]|jgi:uncharacterized membrane protein|nr:PTS sugar transporter subunit IIC [Oscillospiraceae bacterium]MCI8758386.1 PTS sugar transporter subunit IIC [Oscillospiraceae bacterium]MCI9563318.1 PTS sugar transporter subunit IIC [Oscillospiraceae bacterium]